jgi:divinyl protochlorophyllide a 8-vinyl-reductase
LTARGIDTGGREHRQGRVGPNAVLQVAAALRARGGEPAARRVFETAGLAELLDQPPSAMIDERLAASLHRSLRRALAPAEANAVAREAGRLTADYILTYRIPGPAQALLRISPQTLAARLLVSAIGRNAWTFAGSGQFRSIAGSPIVLEIAANPLAMGGCLWHGAVFEGLFKNLVSSRAGVREVACCELGAEACRFEVEL